MSVNDRNIYLDKKTLSQARNIWFNMLEGRELKTEIIPAENAAGRISAEAVRARRSAPHFYAAAMDGYALRAEDTEGVNERNPCTFDVPEQAFEVNTGSAVPEEFNAVIKVEDVEQIDENSIRIFSSVPPWHNLRSIGESVLKGDQLLTTRERITPYHVGALLEAGLLEVEVIKKPQLSVIPTGDEIIPPHQEPDRGETVDFNSAMITAGSRKAGALVERHPIIPDKPEKIEDELQKAVSQSDMVAVIAGSSAGSRDYTADIIDEMGEIWVHGVDIMPGKPVLLGEIDSTPVVGLPGYPLSCLLDFDLFLKPALLKLSGSEPEEVESWDVRIKRKISSTPGVLEFIRVNLRQEEELIAAPRRRGSAAMKSLLQADGYLKIPPEKEGLFSGEVAEIIPLTSRKDVENSLLLLGSNDPALEELRELLAQKDDFGQLKLQSRGSQAGIHALLRGEADVAAAHLLDPETGEYNIPYLAEVAEDDYKLITLAWRRQGFIFREDSSLSEIENLSQLSRSDHTFINRQRGAGTRILLDYHLSRQGIEPDDIKGYNKEEYTHAAVAQAVSSGAADVTLGIKAAARSFDLCFKPLFTERFELIYPADLSDDRRMTAMKEVISSLGFEKSLQELGGYLLEETGLERCFTPAERGDEIDD